jgi:hypothetical protein
MMAVDAEAQTLQDAAARGDFAAAAEAAVRFTGFVRAMLPGLPAGEAERRLGQACELVDGSRRQLRAARVRLAEEVGRLENLRCYHERLSAAEATFRMEG